MNVPIWSTVWYINQVLSKGKGASQVTVKPVNKCFVV
jgi:hypothetical protein